MRSALHGEAYIFEVRLQRRDLFGRDDGADITIGTHEYPVSPIQRIGIADMAAIIDDVAALPKCVYMQSGPKRHEMALHVIAEQRPMRTLNRLKSRVSWPAAPRIGASGARSPASRPPFRSGFSEASEDSG
jgi:hypothetical protein